MMILPGQDGVGNLGGIIEGGGQTSNLTANSNDLLGEEPLEEGPGLVTHTQNPHIVQTLSIGQLLLQPGSDVLVDVGVHCSGQSSV